ncbi:hypothetical protein IGI04_012732, partial [Brassica rapa subsp. trilocularis]
LLIPKSLNLVEREGEENLRSEHERRLSGARAVRRRLMVMTTHELLGGCKVGSLMRANLSVVVVVVTGTAEGFAKLEASKSRSSLLAVSASVC